MSITPKRMALRNAYQGTRPIELGRFPRLDRINAQLGAELVEKDSTHNLTDI